MSYINSEVLYERFLKFAIDCQRLTKSLPRNIYNQTYTDQLIRSSGSPGANYIEAIEASSKKEFILKLKISRRETKESIHWINLIKSSNPGSLAVIDETDRLVKEAQEFIRIFTSSILTSENNLKIETGK